MKKIIPLLIIAALASCSSPVKLLSKTWKITDLTFDADKNSFNSRQQAEIRQQLLHETDFTFKPDSSYIVHKKDETVNGKWWFSSDKKTLYTTNQTMGLIDSKIIKLNGKTLAFETVNKNGQKMIFTCLPVTDKK
jgi:hypothetical protein